ncbi:MAG: hypothetical protein NZ108_03255 [Bacteroidia bacterium]|nr:hypothetical protein [Bacteroidia bacterium]
MIRTVSSLLVITLICGNVLAQTPDFTYKNPDLAGKSAAFTAKKTTFSFSSTTNGKAIELQMPLGTDPSSWLQTLKTWNQPKLTAEDLVFCN